MPGEKKPRIRKTAPTLREQVEAARVKAETPKRQSRLKKVAVPAAKPFKRVRLPHLPDNRFGRILRRVLGWITPRYFINSFREVRLVTWPGRRESWRLTGAVIIFAAVFGAVVAGVDKVLDILFKSFVLK